MRYGRAAGDVYRTEVHAGKGPEGRIRGLGLRNVQAAEHGAGGRAEDALVSDVLTSAHAQVRQSGHAQAEPIERAVVHPRAPECSEALEKRQRAQGCPVPRGNIVELLQAESCEALQPGQHRHLAQARGGPKRQTLEVGQRERDAAGEPAPEGVAGGEEQLFHLPRRRRPAAPRTKGPQHPMSPNSGEPRGIEELQGLQSRHGAGQNQSRAAAHLCRFDFQHLEG
mmetsp:Transcript_3995/g.9551  ORF Transcript_3995/g.9551 Transcript_3995/m.9551 type:complete len:225 (-) Transcript_3995:1366-2040(-)